MTKKRIVLALILSMGLCFIGCDDGKTSSTAGVTVTRPVPAAMETLQEIKANAPLRQQYTAHDRVIPFRKIHRGSDLSVFNQQVYQNIAPAVSSILAPASMAPALVNNFAGFDEPPPGLDVIPPDTMGVAGPNHFVSILNSDFGVFSKTGTILSQVPLDSFWASLGAGFGQPANNPFDPRILYDQHSGRFIASSAGGGRSPSSWILIAVSSTSNPLDNWVKVAIDADLDNNQQLFNNGADFPTLGVDNANIYIAANMYSTINFFQYSKVWVIPKSQLLTGQPGSLTWTEFRDPGPIRNDTFGPSDTLQPAHTFDAIGAEYFVFEAGFNQFHVANITFPGGTPTWTNLGAATVSAYSTSLSPAPQLGTSSTIDTGDTRLLNAVYRDGSLWTTHNVGGAGGKVEVAWYQINPASTPPSVVMQGRINHASRWYYYPSIAVNYNGDVGIGFTGSASTEFAGAYYTARAVSDPAGTMQSVATLQPGGASYFKTLTGTENRWGDYSATSVDPVDDLTFWTVQEYATSSINTWGTWIGSFALPLPSIPSAPDGLTATPSSDSQVNLTWADLSSNERAFLIERKAGAAAFALIDNVIHNSTAYSNTGLSENTTYFYRVKATNISGDSSYSNENSALTLLEAPTGLSAVASSSTLVQLIWTNRSLAATRLLVERKTGASGTYSEIDNIASSASTYSDNTLSAGTTYYYRLKATSSSNSSLYSAEANTTTPGVPRAGGGGGCAIGSDRPSEFPLTPLGTVLILLSPLGVLAWLRRSSVPPRGWPGAP